MAPAQDVDPLKLASAGWGVIFAPDISPEVREALSPLLEHRRKQAGLYYRELKYSSGQSKDEFLAEHGAGPGPADPKELPYYLLIVGDPRAVPFRFQYELDVQYAVGRLFFDKPEEYASYARSVITAETDPSSLPPRRITLFGTSHDEPTSRFVDELIEPLSKELERSRDWRVRTITGDQATKARLTRLLGNERSAVLVTATHGLIFPADDPRQLEEQGSLVSQDWPGAGTEISRDFYFSARDLGANANLTGMILFLLGSYTVGTPEVDEFQDQRLTSLTRIAPQPFVSRLAQSLLSNPGGGALAVFGYIGNPSINLGFDWSTISYTQILENTLKRLIDGHPMGSATEYFNQSHAERSVTHTEHVLTQPLSLTQEDQYGRSAGNFVIIGDPAVRAPITASPASLDQPDSPQGESEQEPVYGRLAGAINDQAALSDQLGFEDYAEAFAELVQSVETQLPLTIGIFGSWGMGKTTLMELITKKLKGPSPSFRGKDQVEPVISKVHVITFSAWEYSARETIWPGLVRKIMDGLEKEISWPFPGRFLIKLGWNLRTALRKERGRIFVITCILVASVAAVVTLLVEGKLSQIDLWKPLVAAGLTGLVGILGGGLKILGDTLSRPMGQWITSALQEDAYGRPIAHFTRIREDLEFLDKRLGADKKRPQRALILIDDLDRCEPGKAVEMLQAIKLLLDFKSFVVCLGIDARIITRAVEKHYKDLLGESGASGYEYLDKIVQIPFRIPVPEKKEIEEFLAEQMGNPQPPRPDEEVPSSSAATDAAPPKQGENGGTDGQRRGVGQSAPPQTQGAQPAAPLPPRATLSAFTHRELQAFQSLVDYLRPNPRHLKRLLNVYRLVRTLADFRGEQILLGKPGATICWVVLCAQWPYTTHLMLRHFLEAVRQADEEKGFQFPSENPLTWLLAEIEKEIDPGVRQRLDHDLNLLRRLVEECPEARMSWQELRVIRRYTINFNPAIELEAIAEKQPIQPAEAEPPRPTA